MPVLLLIQLTWHWLSSEGFFRKCIIDHSNDYKKGEIMQLIQEDMFNPVPDEQKLPSIDELIKQGAMFFVSHSSGKDSTAQYLYLKEIVPFDQITVVHANLGEIEWPGVIEYIKDTIDHELHVVKAGKTFFEMVRHRKMFPGIFTRQCTSDLKSSVIYKFIRNHMKTLETSIAVNCTGVRSAESRNRAKQKAFELNTNQSVHKRVKRTVYNYKLIFDWSDDQVYDKIYDSGLKPFWAYGKRGELNQRLSCVFCIMGSINDLRHGARMNPELYKKYVELEKEIGHTMFMKGKHPISMEEHVGLKVTELDSLPMRIA